MTEKLAWAQANVADRAHLDRISHPDVWQDPSRWHFCGKHVYREPKRPKSGEYYEAGPCARIEGHPKRCTSDRINASTRDLMMLPFAEASKKEEADA